MHVCVCVCVYLFFFSCFRFYSYLYIIKVYYVYYLFHFDIAFTLDMSNNFIEITLQRECSPVNMLHNFRTPLSKNISGGLLLRLPP